MRVDQAIGSAGPHDAVTVQALRWRELLGGSVYAADRAPGVDRSIRPLSELGSGGDALVIHYSGYVPGMGFLLDLPRRRLLVYHNVTPDRYFWSFQPHVAAICRLGREALPRWVAGSAAWAAPSRFNAEELRGAGAAHPELTPILLDRKALERRGRPPPLGGGPLVMTVGRLAPHKRPDLAIRAFAHYQRRHAPDASLALVGLPLDRPFGRALERIAAEAGARNVRVLGSLPQEKLNALYARADVLLSASEHEGFCIPLLEAFHFGLPVVARPAGGMPEVGGDAVLWTDERFDPPLAAELIAVAARNGELREELARRGGARLAEYTPARVRAAIEAFVQASIGSAPGRSSGSTSLREERSGPGTPDRIR